MLIWKKTYFVFYVFWQSAFSEKQVNISFAPLRYKPPENDTIFTVQISTGEQCRYVCMQNKRCLTIAYSTIGSSCTGYKSQTELNPTGVAEKVWKIVFEGWLKQKSFELCQHDRVCLFTCFGVSVLRECKFLSAGKLDIARDPETRCIASGEYNKGNKCSNAYDGITEPGNGGEWAVHRRNPEKWIKVS